MQTFTLYYFYKENGYANVKLNSGYELCKKDSSS